MSTFSIGGLATGLDTNSIITQLMNLERVPEQFLQTQQKKNTSKISEYQKIEDALASLQTVVQGFNTPETFSSVKSTVANESLLTATPTSAATPGTHTVQVISLAKNQRQVSTGVASNTSLIFNTGTFTIDDGAGNITTVSLAEGQNSLQGIASSINSSGANASASIINDGTNYRLVVTGKDTKNYTLVFSGLDNLPAGGTGSLTPTLLGSGDPTYQAGADAQLVVDGVSMTKKSNTITDAIQGVTLDLLTEGSSTSLSVTNDTDAITQKLNNFISAYNKVITLINSESSYNANSKTAGVLSGDSTIQTIQQQLRSLLTATVSGATGNFKSLSSLGIKSDSKTGTLSIDSTKLSDALNNHYSDVVDYFTHNSGSYATLPTNQYGMAIQFDKIIDTMVHPYVADGMPDNGIIEVRKKGLTKTNSDIDKQIDALEERITQMQTNLQNQFNSMETLVSSLQTQGNTLLNYLSSLNS
jgi:flagellar hook-associated protein 2